jgi:phage terminase large subunit-like protein
MHFGGLDLSSTTDITAWCVGKKLDDGYKADFRFYIPEDRARILEDRDRVPYSDWCRDGWVTATPGKVIDYSFVEAAILEDTKKFDIVRLERRSDPTTTRRRRHRVHPTETGLRDLNRAVQGTGTLCDCGHAGPRQ